VIDSYVHTTALMGTVVSFQVVGCGADDRERAERVAGVQRAVQWFRGMEESCSRFDEASEVRRLSESVGTAVPVSAMLFESAQFAIALAEDTAGAFDPTIGYRMQARGFNRHYRTGAVSAPEPAANADAPASFRDVRLDADARTITLLRPMALDLGAVAKGMAVDLAARELAPFENFAIDAGGDLYLGGQNARGEPWSVGVRNPRDTEKMLDTTRVSNMAVCTSGDYERMVNDSTREHHIMDPRTGGASTDAASVTVIAPSAMVADGLATAAFVLGPKRGIALLDRHGVRGLIVTPTLERFATRGGWS
jgi:thiamine biosynthesis lipoprotein